MFGIMLATIIQMIIHQNIDHSRIVRAERRENPKSKYSKQCSLKKIISQELCQQEKVRKMILWNNKFKTALALLCFWFHVYIHKITGAKWSVCTGVPADDGV